MKMTIIINPEEKDKISFEEIKKMLNFLSKEWNIYFEKSVIGGSWNIVANPKNLRKEKDLK
tara:strand:+ start:495 stop:677 length:183 start_codon:yes stop_codon:yes gene_type:complete